MEGTVIAIPTMGRVGNQITLDQLPKRWRDKTYLVCPPNEEHEHQFISCPEKGIHRVRQWIMSNIDAGCIIMLDDDMKFRNREPKPEGGFKLAYSGQEEAGQAMDWLEEAIQWRGFIQAGLGQDYMSQMKNDEEMVGVVIAAHAYDVQRYRKMNYRFDRVRYHEDVDVTLQILRSGFPNIICHKYVRVQPPQQGEGGCSEYRNADNWNRATLKLLSLHKNYLRERWKPMDKEKAESWGGIEGQPTGHPVVYAKKAYKEACRANNLPSVI